MKSLLLLVMVAFTAPLFGFRWAVEDKGQIYFLDAAYKTVTSKDGLVLDFYFLGEKKPIQVHSLILQEFEALDSAQKKYAVIPFYSMYFRRNAEYIKYLNDSKKYSNYVLFMREESESSVVNQKMLSLIEEDERLGRIHEKEPEFFTVVSTKWRALWEVYKEREL